MLFDSPHVRVTAEHGTATLWLRFPGEPANALDLPRLLEVDAALQAVAASPFIRILIVRSGIPGGFCAGLRPEIAASLRHPTERASFAWFGQQVFERLARLDAVTVTFLDGPCLGVGLELALACDYRLCVAHPRTHLGFPDRFTCFGGSPRLRRLIGRKASDVMASGQTYSGREARTLGLVDDAFCERRARIALRTFLDRLERRPRKQNRSTDLIGFAAERRAFAAATPQSITRPLHVPTLNPVPPFPEVVGLVGENPDASRLVAQVALRGGQVVVCGNGTGVLAEIQIALARGFITPLEADQTQLRVRSSDNLTGFENAGLTFVAEGHDPFRLAAVVRPRAMVCVIRSPGADPLLATSPLATTFPNPRRVVPVSFCDRQRIALFPAPTTAPDTIATLALWLKPFGLDALVLPSTARLLPQAA